MSPSKVFRESALFLGLLAFYILAGKLGLRLAFVNASSSAVWAPTGIAIASFLLLGSRIWPCIFLGAFLVNVTTAGNALTSLGIATGNTLEAALAAHLVNRFAGARHAFGTARNIFKFAALAGIVSTIVSATFGVLTLTLAGFAAWNDFGYVWLTWWLGDAVGAIVIAPLLVLWFANPRVRWSRAQVAEGISLAISLCAVGWFVFGNHALLGIQNDPVEFLCIPVLIWAASRFGLRETAMCVFLLAGISIWGTLHGFGPFARGSENKSLLLLQAFVGVSCLMSLTLAAEVAERRRIEAEVRKLSITDPLTGLANYRQFLSILDVEMNRFSRAERPFSVLLLDLDGLKKINDTKGHLVGSMALCRLAEILRANCRSTDTAARFGGDEFAMVLPETQFEGASQLAMRVCHDLANDGRDPPLSVSIGIAVYPQSGATIESLLSAADRELYRVKTAHHS